MFCYTLYGVIHMLDSKQRYYTVKQLMGLGLSYYKINRLVEEGALKKINKSTYLNLKYDGMENSFFDAEAYVPGGIICQMSAARFYGLTTYLPDVVDVAIERSRRIYTLPEWPVIKLHYYEDQMLEMDVVRIKDGLNYFHVFSIEKTVADILSRREKIGIEEAAEVLKNYLAWEDRDLNLLYAYAKDFHCEKILRTYMEVLE